MGLKGLKGGKLEDDGDWTKLGLKGGQTLMLVGTAGELPPEPQKATIFVEDLSEHELGTLVQPAFPPGLTNLGNTCYLNSTVQCFKAIPELNTALKGYSGAGDLAQQMKELFIQLDHSASAVPPLFFVHLFRETFPRFAQRTERGYAQQDAEECYGTLMQALSQALPPLRPDGSASSSQRASEGENAIKQLFRGEMETRYKCLDAPEEEDPPKAEPFLKLMCNIGSSTNFMITGLKEGMKEKIVERSPSVNADLTYEKSQLIAKLPYYLGIQFVRFWWKPDAQIKAKICRPVEFPLSLDVYDLCTEELKAGLSEHRKTLIARDEARQAREKKDAMDVGDAELPQLWERTPYQNDTGFYELFAVITHKGRDAESGHYVAWVKEKDDQWLCFDDDVVKPYKDEDIKQLAGKGGADWHIAYICLYRSKQID